MPLEGGLQLTVSDAHTGNTLLTVTGNLDAEALEIADALLQVPATGKNGVNTTTTTEPVKSNAQGGGGITIHGPDETEFVG